MFPQYRKLQNRAYYKIVSEMEMEELNRLGKGWLRTYFVGKSFLDRCLIRDILSGETGHYVPISEADYKQIDLLAK